MEPKLSHKHFGATTSGGALRSEPSRRLVARVVLRRQMGGEAEQTRGEVL